MKFLLSWALIAVGFMIFFAGMRQNKWWLFIIGTIFSGTGIWYFFTHALHHAP